MMTYQDFYRRHLPHWQLAGATYFVTFRLHGSLPCEVLELLREQREQEKQALWKLPDYQRVKQDYADERRSFRRWDTFLDIAESGPQWLSQSEVAEVIKETLHAYDRQEYDLHAYCIMSNHVHTVFEPLEDNRPLHVIMKSLKGCTAREANLLLGRTGPFWQDESYDHVIRGQEELARIVHYVLDNPVKAGLVTTWEDWPWSYSKW